MAEVVIYEAAAVNRLRLLYRFTKITIISLVVGLVIHLGFSRFQTLNPIPLTLLTINPIRLPPNQPTSISIPSINLNAPIEVVDADVSGQIEAPKNAWHVGWFIHSSKPGNSSGRIILDGHFDSHNGEAVFYNLNRLKPGDVLFLSTKHNTYSYKVTSLHRYPETSVPPEILSPKSLLPELVLITCGGSYNHQNQTYLERDVITAVPTTDMD